MISVDAPDNERYGDTLMTDQTQDRGNSPVLIVFAVVSLFGAFAMYGQERNENPADPNYGVALLLLGAGAFFILLYVISSSGRRPQ